MLGELPGSFHGPRLRGSDGMQQPRTTVLRRVHEDRAEDGTLCIGSYEDPDDEEQDDERVNLANKATEHDHDFPAPFFTEAESRKVQYCGTLAHELTHRLMAVDGSGAWVKAHRARPLVARWAAAFGWRETTTAPGAWECAHPEACVTDYARTENPEEDLCESMMPYRYWPAELRRVCQPKYGFIRDELGVPEVDDRRPARPSIEASAD